MTNAKDEHMNFDDIKATASEPLDAAKHMAQSWKKRAESVIRERPAVCLLGAFAVGFLLAKVARRV